MWLVVIDKPFECVTVCDPNNIFEKISSKITVPYQPKYYSNNLLFEETPGTGAETESRTDMVFRVAAVINEKFQPYKSRRNGHANMLRCMQLSTLYTWFCITSRGTSCLSMLLWTTPSFSIIASNLSFIAVSCALISGSSTPFGPSVCILNSLKNKFMQI